MKESLGFYKIEYLDCKVVQTKELISEQSHKSYQELKSRQSDLQVKIKEGNKKGKKVDPSVIQELKDVQHELKPFSIPFFVVGSPLYEAIETGILDVKASYSKPSPCRITKVDTCGDISISEEDSE